MLEEFKKINVKETWRKAIHIPTAILAPVVVLLFGLAGAEALCVAGLSYIFISSYIEKRHAKKMPVSSYAFELASRGNEIAFPLAQTLYIIAVAIVAILLPFTISFAAFGVLCFGDGMAAMGGMAFGKHKLPYNRKKSFEGMFTGIAFGFLGAMLMGWAGLYFDWKSVAHPFLGTFQQLNGTWMPIIMVALAGYGIIALWIEVFELFMKRRYDRYVAFVGMSLSLLVGLAAFAALVLLGINAPIFADAIRPIIVEKFTNLPFICLVGTIAGMIAESVAGKTDNLVVPLVAAAAMTGTLFLL